MKVRFWLVTEEDDLIEKVVSLPEEYGANKIEEELTWWGKEMFGLADYDVGWELAV